ncbi:flagellar hook-associated protein FlgL [Moritella viscosa]|uniref:Flagellar hook-associated protein n=1 Tax=Moritella viscosa TaxID=80854 RepID=A0ABY1H8G2_9GAMM|nr:flagellar hook-associated protein FlgL [Moritella viscosa]CED58798.1 flagellar hook-associated protein type 3 FlgL [Moritella viscosa]SGY83750.1 Flagellar hook-associated protein [Moritella viscosa]SGY84327.1 Flagellar hook-associated protein [Moritella viscosa]SGY84438.1 Flagellar hook-associated protein [Moritella viscosa]SGY85312.1 Flagellar hook-associated protein [Moritella viscosa]
MRVSTVQLQRTVMSGMERSASIFSHISQQKASGKRMVKPSDDPLGAVKLMALQAEQVSLKQFDTNIENVRRHLSGAETYITSINDHFDKLRDLTLEAGNGTLNEEGRKAIALEMKSVKDSLLATVNSKGSNGKYLFSGSEVEKQPIAGPDPVTGDYSYGGDNGERYITIASGVKVAANVNADATFFDGGKDFFKDVDGYIEKLNLGTEVPGDIKMMLGAVDSSIDTNLQLLTIVGTRLSEIMQTKDTNADISLYGKNLQLSLEQLDYGMASFDLAQAELALKTTQQVYVKASRLSLFNVM